MQQAPQALPPDPSVIAARLPGGAPRVLIIGAMGTGKSTLAAGIAQVMGSALGISADPGSPAFGVPGAVSLGVWRAKVWQRLDAVPLCTLDAGRFRLPLVQAVGRLADRARGRALIVDAPGVSRGVAAAELLQGLAAAASIDAMVVMDTDEFASLATDVAALDRLVIRVAPSPHAHRPPRHERERYRTDLWDAHLERSVRCERRLEGLEVVGTPPPLSAREAWRGRQAALMHSAGDAILGEVVALEPDRVVLNLAAAPDDHNVLLVRDAQRNGTGKLVTAPPAGASRKVAGTPFPRDPGAVRAPVAVSLGGVDLQLVNGVFGDPLLEIEVANVRGKVLFDLGDAAGMPVKALHQVEDVFLSHAHIDHVGGFLDLLRARLSGGSGPCRIYGPAGICEHIAGFVAGVHWDRIGDQGPPFLVAEVRGGQLVWWRIQPGREIESLGSETATAGMLLRRDGFRIRHAVLDHGIPVLAFVLELDDSLQVREERLAHSGLRPGPWLRELKHTLGRGRGEAMVELPDGTRRPAAALGDELLRPVPGPRIAYATDLADAPGNRHQLGRLAYGADLFVCEATFLPADAAQARATKHLTVPACVEIALAAGVRQLLPFHFSRRYVNRIDEIRDALAGACRGTALDGKLVGPVPLVRR